MRSSCHLSSSKKPTVVIIIPTFNEAAGIKNTLMELFAEIMAIKEFDIHVLVFDSASQDNTVSMVLSLQSDFSKLHLQTESKKTGLGSAYLQAMTFALTHLRADMIMEFDADLSHQPKYIAPMLRHMSACDVVVGSRYIRGGSIPQDWGWRRKLLSMFGNIITRLILTPAYKDFTSGFRLIRANLLREILPKAFLSNQYAYKLHLMWLLHKSGATIIEHPIAFIDREEGESKLPRNTIVDSLQVIFTLRYRELKRYFKMCIVGLLGSFVQCLVYNILRGYCSPFHASQIAVLSSIIQNFMLHHRFTFRSFSSHHPWQLRRLGLFMPYSFSMIFFQSYWLQLGTTYFGQGFWRENLILASSIGLGSILNYLFYSRVVWPQTKPLDPDTLSSKNVGVNS